MLRDRFASLVSDEELERAQIWCGQLVGYVTYYRSATGIVGLDWLLAAYKLDTPERTPLQELDGLITQDWTQVERWCEKLFGCVPSIPVVEGDSCAVALFLAMYNAGIPADAFIARQRLHEERIRESQSRKYDWRDETVLHLEAVLASLTAHLPNESVARNEIYMLWQKIRERQL